MKKRILHITTGLIIAAALALPACDLLRNAEIVNLSLLTTTGSFLMARRNLSVAKLIRIMRTQK